MFVTWWPSEPDSVSSRGEAAATSAVSDSAPDLQLDVHAHGLTDRDLHRVDDGGLEPRHRHRHPVEARVDRRHHVVAAVVRGHVRPPGPWPTRSRSRSPWAPWPAARLGRCRRCVPSGPATTLARPGLPSRAARAWPHWTRFASFRSPCVLLRAVYTLPTPRRRLVVVFRRPGPSRFNAGVTACLCRRRCGAEDAPESGRDHAGSGLPKIDALFYQHRGRRRNRRLRI